MHALVDISRFPVGLDIDYTSPEEVEAVKALTAEAEGFVYSYHWMPPVESLTLAFGVGPMIGLFLMRFEPGGLPEDWERWVVVGDLPSMHFETDDTPTPDIALDLYCAIAENWAENVLHSQDLSDSYPLDVPPTEDNARMLLDRVDFIRTKIIPLAQ